MTGGEPVDGVDLGHALRVPEAVPPEGVLSQLTQEPAPGSVPRRSASASTARRRSSGRDTITLAMSRVYPVMPKTGELESGLVTAGPLRVASGGKIRAARTRTPSLHAAKVSPPRSSAVPDAEGCRC